MNSRYKYTHRVAGVLARCTQGVPKEYPRSTQGVAKSKDLLSTCQVLAKGMATGLRILLKNKMTRYFLQQQNKLFWYVKCHTLGSKVPSLRHQNNLFWCGANMRLALKPLFLLLLALFFGMSSVKAQDYSGVYYLSGNNQGTNSYDVNNTTTNFYLCPTENWIYYQATDNFTTSNNGQPFLTTYQYRNGTNDYTKAIWVIKKHLTQNYYYIIHAKDGKYMTANGGISGSKSANRIRVHLEESNSPNGNMLFDIAYVTTISTSDPKNYTPYYDISPQNYSGWFLNITQGNRASLQGTSDKTDGPSYTLNGTTTRNIIYFISTSK